MICLACDLDFSVPSTMASSSSARENWWHVAGDSLDHLASLEHRESNTVGNGLAARPRIRDATVPSQILEDGDVRPWRHMECQLIT